jgi:penicillin-binding protein 2
MIGEADGLVPSRAWKRQAFRERADQVWFPGETVIASIGQGYMLASPLQLANAAAALAMRGKRFKPHIVAAFEDPISGKRTLIVPEPLSEVTIENDYYWDSIIAGMHDVMQSETGTARAAGLGTSRRTRRTVPDGRQERHGAGIFVVAGRGIRRGGT